MPVPRPDSPVPTSGTWDRSSPLWLVVSAVVLSLLTVATWLVISDTSHPRPPFLAADHIIAPPPRAAIASSQKLQLAGSGSNLPITRSLSRAFAPDPSERPIVHASIGSRGGLLALLDGVIDVALVSRPLRDGEREQGLVATPYARIPVIVATHANVVDQALRKEALVEIYAATQTTWSDGSRIIVLQREQGDSSHRSVARVLDGFGEANEIAYRESRWRVLYRDEAMSDALADTDGAIGLFGQGIVPVGRPIQALAIDGVMPSVATVRSGAYPFVKDLIFVTRGPPTGPAKAFIYFALSAPGRTVIEAMGGSPLVVRRPSHREQP